MGTTETPFGRWTLHEWDDFPPMLSTVDIDVTIDRNDETLIVEVQESGRAARIPIGTVRALVDADRVNRIRSI